LVFSRLMFGRFLLQLKPCRQHDAAAMPKESRVFHEGKAKRRVQNDPKEKQAVRRQDRDENGNTEKRRGQERKIFGRFLLQQKLRQQCRYVKKGAWATVLSGSEMYTKEGKRSLKRVVRVFLFQQRRYRQCRYARKDMPSITQLRLIERLQNNRA
jgi:hypothetical protein